MNLNKLIATGLLSLFGSVGPMWAAATVSVDMDTSTAGIQSSRNAAPGDMFPVDLVLTVDASGVSSYGISVFFDTTELMLNGSPASSMPALPGGLFFLTPVTESSPYVYTFNGATLGIGPVSTSFTIGTINFKVPGAATVLNDGLADISLGFYNAGVDGLFDNGGGSVAATFNGGAVVPEPSTWALFLCGMVATVIFVKRRRYQ
jgi:hypothetical protein